MTARVIAYFVVGLFCAGVLAFTKTLVNGSGSRARVSET